MIRRIRAWGRMNRIYGTWPIVWFEAFAGSVVLLCACYVVLATTGGLG